MADNIANQGQALFQSLQERGLSPVHAAALVGHMQQESGFNPQSVNPREGANGLLQWRLDRWDALQKFAKDRGSDPRDQNTQLDFIGHEMKGSERKAGSRFLAATDLPGASAALKSYIRFGDDSGQTRLANASRVLGQPMPAGVAARVAPQQSAASTTSAPFGLAPEGVASTEDAGFAALLDAARRVAQSNQEETPLPSALPPMRILDGMMMGRRMRAA